MRTCFVVPGILGSALATPDDTSYGELLWVNPTRLIFNREFGGLALAANGRDPQPDFGQRCVALGPLEEFYGALYRILANRLRPFDYQVRAWGYDWRKTITNPGNLLVEAIRANATPTDPCSIVAHSQGGLLARWAWLVLEETGEQNLVRRIVTLGTPHRGSYAPVMVWSLQEAMIDQLVFASNLFQHITLQPTWFPWPGMASAEYVEAVIATWPAMYQLMPLVDSDSALYDPRRSELFDRENWPEDRPLSELHLTAAGTIWGDFLRLQASMPPANVLVTVAGVGIPTPWALTPDGEIGNSNAVAFTNAGDGRVPLNSACPIAATAVVVSSGHAGLTSHPVILDRIAGLVLQENPVPPPPSPNQELEPQGMFVSGPPFPVQFPGGSAQLECADGKCVC